MVDPGPPEGGATESTVRLKADTTPSEVDAVRQAERARLIRQVPDACPCAAFLVESQKCAFVRDVVQIERHVPLPAAPNVTPDSALFIIQHPQGQPLKLAFHVVREIKPTRITYGTNTREGSSGSPCFDYRWDLVALHHSGDPAYKTTNNQGIPIAAIRRRLTSQGVSLPI